MIEWFLGFKKKNFNPATFYCSSCTKSGECAVMYLRVRGIATKPVPSQESEWSCICVLGISLPILYQARKVNGHAFVLGVSHCQAYTKPGEWAVMHLCVRDIITKPVPSQESEWSCICVRGIVTKPVPSQESEQSCICVRGIVTKPGKWAFMYLC